ESDPRLERKVTARTPSKADARSLATSRHHVARRRCASPYRTLGRRPHRLRTRSVQYREEELPPCPSLGEQQKRHRLTAHRRAGASRVLAMQSQMPQDPLRTPCACPELTRTPTPRTSCESAPSPLCRVPRQP